MRDRFVGDIGDFGKYGLLRALCGSDLRLGVLWYFVGDRMTRYLEQPGKFRECDERLFDALRELVGNCQRSLAAVEASEILPKDTVFFRDPVPTQFEMRKAWADCASRKMERCKIIFLDPDNGLKMGPSGGRSGDAKFVHYEDLEPFLRQSRTLVIYHDLGRVRKEAEKAEIELHASELRNRGNIVGDIWALRWGSFSRRAYFIIPNGRESKLRPRIKAFLGSPWGQPRPKGPHFQAISFP